VNFPDGDAVDGRPVHPPIRQPYLHEMICTVAAPALAVGDRDGQLRPGTLHGVYVHDRRVLSQLVLTVGGVEPVGVGATLTPDGARFVGVVRDLGDGGADPTVTVIRERRMRNDGLVEVITVESWARVPVRAVVALHVGCDLAELAAAKAGEPAPPPRRAEHTGGTGVQWTDPERGAVSLQISTGQAAEGGTLRYAVDLPVRGRHTATLTLRVTDGRFRPTVWAATPGAPRPGLVVSADDRRLPALVEQSQRDIAALLLSDPLAPDDHFVAAGAPWFLTLFGRDSVWAARMQLASTPDLALGTVGTLARRQGRDTVVGTAEQPGKILHEVRPEPVAHRLADADNRVMTLPPLYYGTVDATPLWVSLLVDCWRWGAPEAAVAGHLGSVERALEWVRASTGSGFLSYIDQSGHGLANQGWKDSQDSIQFRDGRIATGPISLCEVQAYAYAAARQGADLLEAFGRPGADRYREFAEELKARFNRHFWVEDDRGPFPAVALDGGGTPVDTATSNLGHLLGTGLLDDAQTDLVVARLGGADLDSGAGLRTLGRGAAGFNPFAYHGGSVWTHDTAIAVHRLRAAATPAADAVASSLIRGLLSAAATFDYRLPELYVVPPDGSAPIAYPASCRPQGWAAGSATMMVEAALGLVADVPNGRVRLDPLRPGPFGALTVDGLRVGPARLRVSIDTAGAVTVDGDRGGLQIDVGAGTGHARP